MPATFTPIQHLVASFFLTSWLTLSISQTTLAHPSAQQRLTYINNQIAVNPAQQYLYLKRAEFLIQAGQYQRAFDDLAQADLLGTTINSSYYKGLIHSKQKQHTLALPYFNQVLTLHPDHAVVLAARGNSLLALNKYDAALEDFRKLLENTVAPQPSHYINIARLIAQNDYRHALSIIDQGIETLGLNPQLQQHAIDLCLLNNDSQQALTRHKSLQLMMQNNPAWQMQYADLLILHNKKAAAFSALTAAQQLLNVKRKSPANVKLYQSVQQRQVSLAKSLSPSLNPQNNAAQ